MTQEYYDAYDLTISIIDIIWKFWPIAGPLILMMVIITVVGWVHSRAWGRSFDSLYDDAEDQWDDTSSHWKKRSQSS